ncbi:MAG: MFS transporter [Paucibacter sp.]|nr:MFS transporter [Roseateles sp.]
MSSPAIPSATACAPVKHPSWVLVTVCAMALMSTMGVSMPYPILAPIFVGGPVDGFTHFAGLDPRLLMGVALAANPLGILIGSLFIGPLSDRYGRRTLLSFTLVATLLGYLVTALALDQRLYTLFILARFITGLTEGNTAVARALLADMHGQIDRTRAFALLNACLYTGWLMGPLVGGLTLHLGDAVPFLLAAAAMLPCLVVLHFAVPGGPRREGPLRLLRAMREQQSLGLLATDHRLIPLFLFQLAYTLGINALYEFSPLWLLEVLGLGSAGIAWVTAAQCAAMTGASLIAGRLISGPPRLRRAGQAALLAACCIVLLAAAPGWLGVACIVGAGAAQSLYNAVLPAWMSERFADHGQGRVMGLLTTTFCIANVLIALVGSALALLSVRSVMALGGLCCVASALLLLRHAREQGA